MNTAIAQPPAVRNFADALLRHQARGYAVCAKPMRFEKLPDRVATTFAEIGDDNCYYVFETEAEARRRLAEIPPDERLGWNYSVRPVTWLPAMGETDGPTLDLRGFPFAMRAFVVDRAGAVSAWAHRGRFGWRGPAVPAASLEPAGPPAPDFLQRTAAWLRRLVSR